MAPSFSILLGSAFALPAAGFVGPSASHVPLQAPALRASGAGNDAAEPQSRFGASAAAVCTGLAAAGVIAASRRRSALPRAAVLPGTPGRGIDISPPPTTVFKMDVDVKYPVPGSEKVLNTMVGADVEMGTEPWDPLGFGKLYDRNFDFNNVMVYPHVQWLREAELKHGRVCMLAFVGMIAQSFYQIPGLPQEPDWSKTLDVMYYGSDQVAQLSIVQLSVFAMIIEGKFFPEDAWIGQMQREPGDLGFDPLKWSKRPGVDLKQKQLSELKNGRLAMIGVASIFANHAIPGSVPFLTGFFAVRPEKQSAGAASTFCGKTGLPVAQAESKMERRYTTQVILPALQWLKTGLKLGDLQASQLRARNLAGVDVLVGKDGSGKLFCVANLCPHIGTPMSEGADVIGDVIVCPLHGSSFKVTTGELIDWCPSPPIIGPLTGFVIEKKNLAVFEVRSSFFGGDVEVLVDTNAKKAYEADYWKGLLDAQGKDDGTYY